MIAVATAVLFSITALAVGLVLLDSGLKFFNAVKGLRRQAAADRISRPSQTVERSRGLGVVTAVRLRTAQSATIRTQRLRPSAAPIGKATQRHAVA